MVAILHSFVLTSDLDANVDSSELLSAAMSLLSIGRFDLASIILSSSFKSDNEFVLVAETPTGSSLMNTESLTSFSLPEVETLPDSSLTEAETRPGFSFLQVETLAGLSFTKSETMADFSLLQTGILTV